MGRIALPLDDEKPTKSRSKPLVLFALLLCIAGCIAWSDRGQAISYFDYRVERYSLPDLYDASIDELQRGVRLVFLTNSLVSGVQLSAGDFASEDLVHAYLGRIEEVNHRGAKLNAVEELSPFAIEAARELDRERQQGHLRGPLHGVAILLKANIATRGSDGMSSATAGSYALANATTSQDAEVTRRLRDAGAIILGKTSMNEWAGLRGPWGWSAAGGQVTSPFWPNGTAAGSSSGSGVATTIGLSAAALGTDTTGSVNLPASVGNVVGVRPSLGLLSRSGVVPLSLNRDTVGPLARSTRDAALLMDVLAGHDTEDPMTLAAPPLHFLKSIEKRKNLKGVRIGVVRDYNSTLLRNMTRGRELLDAGELEAFDRSVAVLRQLGARIADPTDFSDLEYFMDTRLTGLRATDKLPTMLVDFKQQMQEFLQNFDRIPSGVKSLKDVIEFNKQHAVLEGLAEHDQANLEHAEMEDGYSSEYLGIVAREKLSAHYAVESLLRRHRLDAVAFPMSSWLHLGFCRGGYPVISVPGGFLAEDSEPYEVGRGVLAGFPGQPFGLAFAGPVFSDADLLSYAHVYERATNHRQKRRAMDAAVPTTQLGDVMRATVRLDM